jgi:hypothetical protein
MLIMRLLSVVVAHQVLLLQPHQITMVVTAITHRLSVKPQQVVAVVVALMVLFHETVRVVGLVAVVRATVGLLVLVAQAQLLKGLRAVMVLERQTIILVVAVVLMLLALTQRVLWAVMAVLVWHQALRAVQ